jgi:hypothetical protein
MADNSSIDPKPVRRSRRRVAQWALAIAGVAAGVLSMPSVVGFATNSSPSLGPVTSAFEAAGYACEPRVSGKQGIITDAVVCAEGSIQFDISSHSNDQKQDEIARFIRSGVGCSLARSRGAESFVLLMGDRVTIYVAGSSSREIVEEVPPLGSYTAEDIACETPTTSGGPIPPSM